MIAGYESDPDDEFTDYSTIEFIIKLIDESAFDLTATEKLYQYGIEQGTWQ